MRGKRRRRLPHLISLYSLSLAFFFSLFFIFLSVVAEMVKCSDAEFMAFRKRKTSQKVSREGRRTSGTEAGGDGETPSMVPGTEPPISKAPGETSTVREPMGVPEEVGADRAGAAKMT